MPLTVLPDTEKLAVDYLKTVTEVTTFTTGSRIGTERPKEFQAPFLVVRRFGGVPVVEGWLDRARLQVDAYGRTKTEARQLAATAQAALRAMEGRALAGGVVTAVEDELGLTWQPDDQLPDERRSRYLFGVAVLAHP